jgi:CheY-like chemotaxis protein
MGCTVSTQRIGNHEHNYEQASNRRSQGNSTNIHNGGSGQSNTLIASPNHSFHLISASQVQLNPTSNPSSSNHLPYGGNDKSTHQGNGGHSGPTSNSSTGGERNKPNSNNSNSNDNNGGNIGLSIQDEARSYRSKVSAIKMLARQNSSYESFCRFLEEIGKAEYLVCFRDIQEIKKLPEDQMISRTSALVWRYKAIYESFKIYGHNGSIGGNSNNGHHFSGHHAPSSHISHKSNASSHTNPNTTIGGVIPGTVASNQHIVWECFGKLKSIDFNNVIAEVVYKYLVIAENDIISRLVMPFEGYLASAYYKAWHDEQLDEEKRRNQIKKAMLAKNNSNPNNINSVHSTGTTPIHGNGTSPASPSNAQHTPNLGMPGYTPSAPTSASKMVLSPRTPTAATNNAAVTTPSATAGGAATNGVTAGTGLPDSSYPEILIVDDSNVTLKLAGLTLERDGYSVEKATNGQIALSLMKERLYDVVLIDCNMPVMDGFEAVRIYREYEAKHLGGGGLGATGGQIADDASAISSISDSDGDFPVSARNPSHTYDKSDKDKPAAGVKTGKVLLKLILSRYLILDLILR